MLLKVEKYNIYLHLIIYIKRRKTSETKDIDMDKDIA